MQVKVLLKQNLMPKFYRSYALSFVKECLKTGNKDLYSEIYETKKVVEKKPFSFEIFFRGAKIGDMYLIEKLPVLSFSTNNAELLNAFLKGLTVLSNTGYSFYISEHLQDIVKPKILKIEKKLISNVLSFKNFLLPESAERWKEETKGMSLKEKVMFYFTNQGIKIKEIYHLKEKKIIEHKFRNIVLKVRPIELSIKVEADSKEKLMDVVYNGIGWFSSEGFGYTKPVRKKAKMAT